MSNSEDWSSDMSIGPVISDYPQSSVLPLTNATVTARPLMCGRIAGVRIPDLIRDDHIDWQKPREGSQKALGSLFVSGGGVAVRMNEPSLVP